MPDRVTITTSSPSRQHIAVDDTPIEDGVLSADIALRPGRPPRITLDFAVWSPDETGGAVIEVQSRTHDALVALGWTPPAEPAPEPTEAHKHAERIISHHAKAIEWLSIGKMLADEARDLSDADYDSLCEQVAALIQSADVTVTWRATPEGSTR